MENSIEDLLQHYSRLETHFTIIDSSNRFNNLVTASTNYNYPIQRWYHLKEAYSIDLLENLLIDWKIDALSVRKVLDPFCGIGTTLLSVEKIAHKFGHNKIAFVGFECNPFLKFVANTKLNWHFYDINRIKAITEYLLDGTCLTYPNQVPILSTLHRSDVYKPETLNQILGYKNAIISLGGEERDPLLLGFANTLEELSGIRKDGRALRIVPNKKRPQVSDALKLAWSKIVEDINIAPNFFIPVKANIFLGDGRTLRADIPASQEYLSDFDLAVYSPPYLNNIDYTEVYKIELWLCGFINSYEEFRALRRKTFRSHPSINFTDPVTIFSDNRLIDVSCTLDVLLNTLPTDKDKKWRTRLFIGYFDDVYQTLTHQRNALTKGGWIFCIVGNSLHGSSKVPGKRIPVATDLIIASIAQAIGLEVKAIQVARHLRRRSPDTKFLRESIIIMRKSENGNANDVR
jgi:DNA modification methylase